MLALTKHQCDTPLALILRLFVGLDVFSSNHHGVVIFLSAQAMPGRQYRPEAIIV